MPLLPLNADEPATDDDDAVVLTGIEVAGNDRQQLLEALRLNRALLHENQPDAEVDTDAIRQTINDLLDRLAETS